MGKQDDVGERGSGFVREPAQYTRGLMRIKREEYGKEGSDCF